MVGTNQDSFFKYTLCMISDGGNVYQKIMLSHPIDRVDSIHGGDSIDTTCAVVRDVTAYIAVVRVFRFSSEYYGCRYHRCPYFSAHRANRSSLISAFITENCQEDIYRYYKRLSSFLNIKTITRIYF